HLDVQRDRPRHGARPVERDVDLGALEADGARPAARPEPGGRTRARREREGDAGEHEREERASGPQGGQGSSVADAWAAVHGTIGPPGIRYGTGASDDRNS